MDLHRHLDDELSSLRDRVLLLGGEAEQALERAMYAQHLQSVIRHAVEVEYRL